MGLMSEFEPGIFSELDELFGDAELTASITYQLYQGTDQSGETFEDIEDLVVVLSKRVLGKGEIKRGVQVQAGGLHILIRESYLPAGVTNKTLSLNDKVVYDSQTYDITGMDKTLGFLVSVICEGG